MVSRRSRRSTRSAGRRMPVWGAAGCAPHIGAHARTRWRKEATMQLSALADEFLLDCRARRLSPRTIAWYRSNLRYFLDWLAGEGVPDRLASFTLQQARRYSHMLA